MKIRPPTKKYVKLHLYYRFMIFLVLVIQNMTHRMKRVGGVHTWFMKSYEFICVFIALITFFTPALFLQMVACL